MRQAHSTIGAASNAALLMLGSIAVVALLVGLLVWNPVRDKPLTGDSGEPIWVYCAAGIMPPVEQAAEQFEQEVGVQVRLISGNSGSLEATIRNAHRGDLYIPADVSFVDKLRADGLAREAIPLAEFRLVLAVQKGNPKNIASLDDLFNDGVTYALATPTAGVGKTTMQVLSETGNWDRVRSGAKVEKETVNSVALDVQEGFVDAGFIWDALARQYGLDTISLPQLDKPKGMSSVTAGVLELSERPTDALRFARYLAAPGKGQDIFAKHHYETKPGDPWALTPQITLYAGGLNSVGVKQTIADFKKREGVQINETYLGCGTLVGMMQAGQHPDAYFACDLSYSEDVADLFNPFQEVSETRMVLLVPPNSDKVKTLTDLGKPGLKIGLADPKQSALGGLSVTLLKDVGVYDDVVNHGNVAVTAGTADILVAQLTESGGLDAVVVYEANCNYIGDKARIIPIDHPLAIAVQPIGVNKTTQYPQLMSRLIDAITSQQSRQRFEDAKFEWKWRGK